jgi:hypothetical protein
MDLLNKFISREIMAKEERIKKVFKKNLFWKKKKKKIYLKFINIKL